MTRKKNKQTRKYEPRDEFRMNRSPVVKGHPHYVFGFKNGKYKSLGITHSPRDDQRAVELIKNHNPKDSSKAYIQLKKIHTDKTDYYGEVLDGWSFSDEDKPIVRHRKKEYKKSYNRGHKKRR